MKDADMTEELDQIEELAKRYDSRAPLPAGALADALERIETDTMIEFGLRTIHGENVLAMAAALIRQLKAENERMREFVSSVSDVGDKIDGNDLQYAITDLVFGRGSPSKKSKTEVVVAAKTLREVVRAAQSLNQTERGEG